MTVKELKEALKDIPDDTIVSFASDGGNPYDDFWEFNSIVRVTDLVDHECDRVCFLD